MYQILKALDYTNSKGIMHRDIKIGNLAFDHSKRKVTIIDWGLADFYRPDEEYGNPGTRCYKAPEIMLKEKFYNYAVDMWSVGIVFAELMFSPEENLLYCEEEDDDYA